MIDFWDSIDAILIINLPYRQDRWEHQLARLREIGVADKAVRINAIQGTKIPGYGSPPWFRKKTSENVSRMKAGAAGCCLSHRKALKFASSKNWNRILLLEDDARFLDPLTGSIGEELGKSMEEYSPMGMLYLGFYRKYCPHVPIAKFSESSVGPCQLWRIRGPLMFHATVIEKHLFQPLLSGLPTERNIWPWMTYWGSIDSWIQNSFGDKPTVKIYGLRPSLVVQQANYSDICGRVLTVEESEGTHRPMDFQLVSESSFQKNNSLRLFKDLYQKCKRGSRVARAYAFGYRKS